MLQNPLRVHGIITLFWYTLVSAVIFNTAPVHGAILPIRMNGATPPSTHYSIVNQGSASPGLIILRPPSSPSFRYDVYCVDGCRRAG